jgi:hypothetical protein
MVPYALAIAAGALLVIGLERSAADAKHRNPLEFHPLEETSVPPR